MNILADRLCVANKNNFHLQHQQNDNIFKLWYEEDVFLRSVQCHYTRVTVCSLVNSDCG